MSMELSNKEWLLTFSPGGEVRRRKAVAPGDIAAVSREVEKSRQKFKLPADAPVQFCYEAGRDGFWIARALQQCGYHAQVVDSAAIEVSRRARRAKTDPIDGEKLLQQLLRYLGGEKKALHVVRIPTLEQEDLRRRGRERERLKTERTGHLNRISSLLCLHGVKLKVRARFETEFAQVLCRDGKPLPENLRAEILREYQRLKLVTVQLEELKRQRNARLKTLRAQPMAAALSAEDRRLTHMILALMSLCGVGEVSAEQLVLEYFGWRQFKNRRQVGGILGLDGTPYSSGGSEREQGISKAGRARMRGLMIELAWSWLRYQPGSKISVWYTKRCAGQNKRVKRRAIVAVARQLAVALWRYAEHGVIPEGAVLKKQLTAQA